MVIITVNTIFLSPSSWSMSTARAPESNGQSTAVKFRNFSLTGFPAAKVSSTKVSLFSSQYRASCLATATWAFLLILSRRIVSLVKIQARRLLSLAISKSPSELLGAADGAAAGVAVPLLPLRCLAPISPLLVAGGADTARSMAV